MTDRRTDRQTEASVAIQRGVITRAKMPLENATAVRAAADAADADARRAQDDVDARDRIDVA